MFWQVPKYCPSKTDVRRTRILTIYTTWVFPKNRGGPPQIMNFNRLSPWFSPFWGFSIFHPYFWLETPIWCRIFFCPGELHWRLHHRFGWEGNDGNGGKLQQATGRLVTLNGGDSKGNPSKIPWLVEEFASNLPRWLIDSNVLRAIFLSDGLTSEVKLSYVAASVFPLNAMLRVVCTFPQQTCTAGKLEHLSIFFWRSIFEMMEFPSLSC